MDLGGGRGALPTENGRGVAVAHQQGRWWEICGRRIGLVGLMGKGREDHLGGFGGGDGADGRCRSDIAAAREHKRDAEGHSWGWRRRESFAPVMGVGCCER
jgi:hypothetical protein